MDIVDNHIEKFSMDFSPVEGKGISEITQRQGLSLLFQTMAGLSASDAVCHVNNYIDGSESTVHSHARDNKVKFLPCSGSYQLAYKSALTADIWADELTWSLLESLREANYEIDWTSSSADQDSMLLRVQFTEDTMTHELKISPQHQRIIALGALGLNGKETADVLVFSPHCTPDYKRRIVKGTAPIHFALLGQLFTNSLDYMEHYYSKPISTHWTRAAITWFGLHPEAFNQLLANSLAYSKDGNTYSEVIRKKLAETNAWYKSITGNKQGILSL